MAITHVNTQTTVQNEGGTSVTVSKPAGAATGDVMLAFTVSHDVSVTPPAGWTERADAAIGPFRAHIFSKVDGGSEPSNYTFSTGVPSLVIGAIAGFRGVSNTTPIDIAAATDWGGSLSEPVDTPDITGGTGGRMVYFRCTRNTSNTNTTFTASGVTEIADFGGKVSTGTTYYNMGVYIGTSDYSGSSTHAGLDITASSGEYANVMATLALRAGTPVCSGPLGATLPQLAPDFAGAPSYQGTMACTIPKVPYWDAQGWTGPTEGSLAAPVPVVASFAGGVPPAGALSVVVTPTVTSQAETARFTDNTIRVPDESRWLIILQDDIVLGNRKTAKKEGFLSVAINVGVVFPATHPLHVAPEQTTASVQAFQPLVQKGWRAFAGTVTVSVTANDATKAIKAAPSTVSVTCHN